jgi:uncharacterized membrane protein
VSIASRIDARAVRLALVVTAAVAWGAALVAAPYLASRRPPSTAGLRAATAVYLVGSIVCHQKPARSFPAWSLQMPVCARCLGLHLSAVVGILVMGVLFPLADRAAARPVVSRTAVGLLGAAAVPTLLALAYEWVGGGDPGNAIRAAAAMPLGLATGGLVAGALSGYLR